MAPAACNKLPHVKIAVARETREGEARVAMVPELVGNLTGLGCEVLVEPGAGERAEFADVEYVEAGASVSESALSEADVVVAVQPPSPAALGRLREGAAVVSFLPVNSEHDLVVRLRDVGLTS